MDLQQKVFKELTEFSISIVTLALLETLESKKSEESCISSSPNSDLPVWTSKSNRMKTEQTENHDKERPEMFIKGELVSLYFHIITLGLILKMYKFKRKRIIVQIKFVFKIKWRKLNCKNSKALLPVTVTIVSLAKYVYR
ncbi:hypothetical protein MKW98_011305 [Papaver atlanticum]|uniref:Uncharacterized protein n=1 Tax=Papaver atlanticum TaxID=357466 RepID=A0AAD4SWX0_9MAGN|nr:hypothetical protein MKW98_011305 [Papaver atlanticum]